MPQSFDFTGLEKFRTTKPSTSKTSAAPSQSTFDFTGLDQFRTTPEKARTPKIESPAASSLSADLSERIERLGRSIIHPPLLPSHEPSKEAIRKDATSLMVPSHEEAEWQGPKMDLPGWPQWAGGPQLHAKVSQAIGDVLDRASAPVATTGKFLLDAEITGAERVHEGLTALSAAMRRTPDQADIQTETLPPTSTRQEGEARIQADRPSQLRAVNQVIGGMMQMGTVPLVVSFLAAESPALLAIELGAAALTAEVITKGGEELGADPDWTEFFANIGAMAGFAMPRIAGRIGREWSGPRVNMTEEALNTIGLQTGKRIGVGDIRKVSRDRVIEIAKEIEADPALSAAAKGRTNVPTTPEAKARAQELADEVTAIRAATTYLAANPPAGATTTGAKWMKSVLDLLKIPNPISGPSLKIRGLLSDKATETITPDVLDGVSPVVEPVGRAPKAPEPEPVKYASTQINLPKDVSERVLEIGRKIPDEDLAVDGREGRPHVTVKYGLQPGQDVAALRKVVEAMPPVTVRLGPLSIFPNSESGTGDVLKSDVDSPDLHQMNRAIAEAFETTDTHPTYQPHVTVAYLKPGKAESYIGNDSLAGQTATIDRVVFSTPDGRKVEIPLKGKTSETAPVVQVRPEEREMTPEGRALVEEKARLLQTPTPYGARNGGGPLKYFADPTEAAVWDAIHSREDGRQDFEKALRKPDNEIDATIKRIIGTGETFAGNLDYASRDGKITVKRPVEGDTVVLPVAKVRDIAKALFQRELGGGEPSLPPAVAEPTPTAEVAPIAEPRLPRELVNEKSRFNIGPMSYRPVFSNDIDRAAFIVAQSTPSKRDADYLKFVTTNTRLTEDEARAYGRFVRETTKDVLKGEPEGDIAIPPIGWERWQKAVQPKPEQAAASAESAPATGKPTRDEIWAKYQDNLTAAAAANPDEYPWHKSGSLTAEHVAARMRNSVERGGFGSIGIDGAAWKQTAKDFGIKNTKKAWAQLLNSAAPPADFEPGIEPASAPVPIEASGATMAPEPSDVTPRGSDRPRLDRPGQPTERGVSATGGTGVGGPDVLEGAPTEALPGTRSEGAGGTPEGDPEGVVGPGVRHRPDAVPESQIAEVRSGGDLPRPALPTSGATGFPGTAQPDYQLTPERVSAIISRGPLERINDNLDAVGIAKELQAAQRYPTLEEQVALSKYVGWGASDIAPFLEDRPRGAWTSGQRAAWDRLQAETTREDRLEFIKSTPNAHFTFDIYEPIWDVIRESGFLGGRVLEPAVGTGHAFGFMPADIRTASVLTASEQEPLTAAIAQALYPSARVQPVGFEKIRLPKGTQDLVISNVPFGDFGVRDPKLEGFLTERIHNYFFAKALQFTRPGGLVMFVTSRYTMDGGEWTKVRKYLTTQAHFLGALRLPNSAFGKSAKTEVVTDLIVLQKLAEGETPRNADLFVKTGKIEAMSGGYDTRGQVKNVYRSGWYDEHPELLLGTESTEGTQYGPRQYTLSASSEDLAGQIRTALRQILPEGSYQPAILSAQETAPIAEVIEKGTYKAGELRVSADGNSIVRVDADGVLHDTTPMRIDKKSGKATPDAGAVQRIKGMVGIRDVRRELVALMRTDGVSDAEVATAQKRLTKAYDKFVKVHGILNNPTNKRLFEDDPEAPNILELEITEPKASETISTKTGKKTIRVRIEVTGKADIFTKRTIRANREIDHADTPEDALMASLGTRTRIDWPYMSRITGQSVQQLQQQLMDAGRIYEDPTGAHVLSEEYLSGDVVTKLEDAIAGAETDPKRFEKNVAALTALQPVRKGPADIVITLGTHWVNKGYIRDYMAHELGVGEENIGLSSVHTEALVAWSPEFSYAAERAGREHPLAVAYGNRNESGDLISQAGIYGVTEMLKDILNLKMPTVTWEVSVGGEKVRLSDSVATLAVRGNMEALRGRWQEWVASNPEVENSLVETYNTRFNRTVQRVWDGSHLQFPGLALPFPPHPHQKNYAYRGLTSGNTLGEHAVGAGKTYAAIMLGMMMRQTGRARKVSITVPTNLLSQWRRDIFTAYPTAKVAAFDEKDLEKNKRQRAMAKIAHGDWDLVLLPHSSFELLHVSDERMVAMWQAMVDELQHAEDVMTQKKGRGRQRDPSIKELERKRRQIEDKIAKKMDKMNASGDRGLVWEDLGIDALIVDEAHCFPYEAKVLTDIGELPIGQIVENRLPVRVLAVNLSTGRSEWKLIQQWHKNQQSAPMMRIHFNSGHVTCTANHSIWTSEEGFIRADHIRPGHHHLAIAPSTKVQDREGVPSVWDDVSVQANGSEEHQEAPILQLFVCSQMANGSTRTNQAIPNRSENGHIGQEESRYGGADASEQSNEVARNTGEDATGLDRKDISSQGWQRPANGATVDGAQGYLTPNGSDYRGRTSEGDVAESSQLLQGRSRTRTSEGRDRDRREDAQTQKMALSRSTEGSRPSCARVERVEVLERESTFRSARGCGGNRTVYCLGVEGEHNFFADGVLVSNSFKNLFAFTKMDRIRGLSLSESDKSLDMYVKIQDINVQSNFRNLHFLTATPIMNSLSEMFTMQRYLQPQRLRDLGIDSFDSWYQMFGHAVPSTEQRPDGTYHEVMRVREFNNVQLLYSIASEVMDHVGNEDMPYLKLPPIKGGKVEVVDTDPHPQYGAIKEWFSDRLDALRRFPPHFDQNKEEWVAPDQTDPLTRQPVSRFDNIITVMGHAKLAAIDVRLILGNRAKDYPGSRIQKWADNVAKIYKAEKSRGGTILTFADAGTPKEPEPLEFLSDVDVVDERGDEAVADDIGTSEFEQGVEASADFNLYEAMKAELVARGIPSREIAYIHQARNGAERLALFNAMNEGKVRVMFASTDKGGVGMNVQRRLAAVLHFDAPRYARPGDITQREGRGIRQGNLYADWGGLTIQRYVTKGTTDEWLYGLIGDKDNFIQQFIRGRSGNKYVERDANDIQEAKIAATGDPRGVELTQLRGSVMRLEAQAASSARAMGKAKADIVSERQRIGYLEKDLSQLQAWLKSTFVSLKGKDFAIQIDKTTYTDREQANQVLIQRLDPSKWTFETMPVQRVVGTVGGVEIQAYAKLDQQLVKEGVKGGSIVVSLSGKDFGESDLEVTRLDTHETILVRNSEGSIIKTDIVKVAFGKGRDVVASVVSAYGKIPTRVEHIQAGMQSSTESIARAEKVLAEPPESIQKLADAKARIEALEKELKVEGAAPVTKAGDVVKSVVIMRGRGKTAERKAKADAAKKDEPMVWRNANDQWEQVPGRAVTLDGAPEGYTFSVFRQGKEWFVVEDSSGRSLGGPQESAKKAAENAERMLQAIDAEQFKASVAAAVTKSGPRPEPDEGGAVHQMQAGATTPLASQRAKRASRHVTAAAPALKQVYGKVAKKRAREMASMAMRGELARLAHSYERAVESLKEFRPMFVRLSKDPAAVLRLADAIEEGRAIPAEFQDVVPALRVVNELYAEQKQAVEAAGIEKQWREHYLARGNMWPEGKMEVELLKRLVFGKKPLQGAKAFLKQRSFPTLRDRVEATGQQPPTWNLIDLQIEKIREMARFVMGKRLSDWMKGRAITEGGAMFVPIGKKAPKGLEAIDDGAFTVYAPPTITVYESYDKALMEGLEQWANDLGIPVDRRPTASGVNWGSTDVNDPDHPRIKLKFGGPESAFSHEIGHALDSMFSLGDELRHVENAEAELVKLAELRYEGVSDTATDKFKRYVQRPEEQVANAVHAYIWAPTKMQEVAPNVYNTMARMAQAQPEFAPLEVLQGTRSLVLTSRSAEHRLPGPMLMGRYYALPEVARIVNNYTRPGLGGRSMIFDAYRWMNNMMTRTILMGSGFHFVAITNETAAMAVGNAMTAALSGRPLRATTDLTMSAAFPAEAYQVFMKGIQAESEYLSTDPGSVMLNAVTRNIILGGQRIRMESDYSNHSLQKLRDSLQKAEWAGTLYHLVPAVVESLSIPVMEWYVPRIKLGVYLDRIERRLDDLPGDPTFETLQRICTEESDHVDNAFGEMVKDNLHWSRILRDVLQVAMLSPTWNLGSVRGFSGGVSDLKRLMPSQRRQYEYTDDAGVKHTVSEPMISVRTAWAIGVLVMLAYTSNLYQIAHGAGPTKNLKDLFHPRNGRMNPNGTPERRTMPGYGKDLYSFFQDPPKSMVETMGHKMAPMLRTVLDIVHNEDYFGTEIRNPDDPLRTQAKQLMEYLFLEQARPITVQNILRDMDRGATVDDIIEGLFGIGHASSAVSRTQAEEKIREYMGPSHRTHEQEMRADLSRRIRQGIQSKTTAGRAQAQEAIASGQLSEKQILTAVKGSKVTGLQAGFKRMTLDQALRVYDVATEDERRVLKPLLIRKSELNLMNSAPATRKELLGRVKRALQLPVAVGQ